MDVLKFRSRCEALANKIQTDLTQMECDLVKRHIDKKGRDEWDKWKIKRQVAIHAYITPLAEERRQQKTWKIPHMRRLYLYAALETCRMGAGLWELFWKAFEKSPPDDIFLASLSGNYAMNLNAGCRFLGGLSELSKMYFEVGLRSLRKK